MALPSSSTPTSSSWPLESGHPGVGVAGADGQFDPVGGVVVGFAVQVQGVGDGLRERRRTVSGRHRPGLDEDLLGLLEHPGVGVPGGTFDGGDDGPDLLDPDRPRRSARRRVPAGPGRLIPEGCICGRIIFAVFTRALASAAEIVRVSRSSEPAMTDPNRAAVCRVSISPATRTCAAYPNRAARSSMDAQRQQIQFRDLPEIHGSAAVFRAAHATVTSACAESSTVSIRHTKNTSPEHRQSLFCNSSHPAGGCWNTTQVVLCPLDHDHITTEATALPCKPDVPPRGGASGEADSQVVPATSGSIGDDCGVADAARRSRSGTGVLWRGTRHPPTVFRSSTIPSPAVSPFDRRCPGRPGARGSPRCQGFTPGATTREGGSAQDVEVNGVDVTTRRNAHDATRRHGRRKRLAHQEPGQLGDSTRSSRPGTLRRVVSFADAVPQGTRDLPAADDRLVGDRGRHPAAGRRRDQRDQRATAPCAVVFSWPR